MGLFSWLNTPKVSAAVLALRPPEKLMPVPIAIPTSSAALPELEKGMFDEYLKVAKSLGLETYGATLDERLRHFLAEENIPVYDEIQVAKYLNQQFGNGGWMWCGLRECDAEHLKGWSTGHGNTIVRFWNRQYPGAVPLPVLLTVKKIADRFPKVHFYISSTTAENKKGDPFLMIAKQGTINFIVERWDEPGFRDVVAEV